jgi:hypothetical protein
MEMWFYRGDTGLGQSLAKGTKTLQGNKGRVSVPPFVAGHRPLPDEKVR